ncbi:hypothetical protein TNCV_1369741 [Trichonephila clavipes]|nr:hypothetical protein TNCV_1369741 [Trichonephila clavipes]
MPHTFSIGEWSDDFAGQGRVSSACRQFGDMLAVWGLELPCKMTLRKISTFCDDDLLKTMMIGHNTNQGDSTNAVGLKVENLIGRCKNNFFTSKSREVKESTMSNMTEAVAFEIWTMMSSSMLQKHPIL